MKTTTFEKAQTLYNQLNDLRRYLDSVNKRTEDYKPSITTMIESQTFSGVMLNGEFIDYDNLMRMHIESVMKRLFEIEKELSDLQDEQDEPQPQEAHKEDTRRFLCIWGASYAHPKSTVVGRSFFTDDNGYDNSDRFEIDTLSEIGQVYQSESDHWIVVLPDMTNEILIDENVKK
jgi:hypothetical protein